jgi:hypothetical protein
MTELVSWLITGIVAPGALTPFVPWQLAHVAAKLCAYNR